MATICVFCASSRAVPAHYVDLAAEVGAELARRGHSLVTGGGSVSLMGAVARAAREGGARTVGVIPHAILALEIADHDADELVVVETMRERKGEMDRRSDAFITLPGGIGTLEELLEVWTARTLLMHAKPVVICDPDDAYAPLRAQIDQIVDRGFARQSINDSLVWTRTAAEALDAVEAGIAHPPHLPEPPATELLEADP
ncbi:MAG TPA: TIGR00730 family Rossman fold protein [Mycobacteriales bacterium]|nr:TIGR00730 family Rossman fold protein [Mycobacteriales bacterium]